MKNTQQLAIMFADIAGSTQLYETVGNNRAREITSRCIELLSQVTLRYQGRVIKTIGDEVMCIFPSSDQAGNAAIHMQESVLGLESSLSYQLHVRIGFHFGEVIMEKGDVFGDAVNLAARMASQAKADQIITTGDTLETMNPYLRMNSRPLITTTVKGKSDPIQICELTWGETEELTIMGGGDVSMTTSNAMGRISFADQTIEVNEANVSLSMGRDKNNTFCVMDNMASRVHAMIERRRGKIVLIDKSTNGTYVRNARRDLVFVHRDEYVLEGEGVIGLGQEVDSRDPYAVHFSC